jgi:outer membrane protein OmpA-like peptidoglycan-associated protein
VRFQVTDGSAQSNIASRSIEVSVPPEPVIDTSPPAPPTFGAATALSITTASFAFEGEPGGSFECSLDDGPFTPCTSPAAYDGIGVGKHSFRVRQTDQAGNTGSAARFRWEILPDGSTNTLLPDVDPTALPGSPSVKVDCKVDEGALKWCEVDAYMGGGAGGAGVSKRVKIGHGKKRVVSREDVQRTTLELVLNKRGRRALKKNPFGLSVTLEIAAKPYFLEKLRRTQRVTLLARSFLIVPRFGLFDGYRASLGRDERRYLRRIARLIGDDARAIRCEGHTATTGARGQRAARIRYRLGLRRAENVCRYLGRLLPGTRLRSTSHGARRPRATNRTRRGRALNRRVEIRVFR